MGMYEVLLDIFDHLYNGEFKYDFWFTKKDLRPFYGGCERSMQENISRLVKAGLLEVRSVKQEKSFSYNEYRLSKNVLETVINYLRD